MLGERANGTVDETPLSDDAVGHRAALGTDRAEAESALHPPGPRCACASKTARVRGTNKPLAHAGTHAKERCCPAGQFVIPRWDTRPSFTDYLLGESRARNGAEISARVAAAMTAVRKDSALSMKEVAPRAA